MSKKLSSLKEKLSELSLSPRELEKIGLRVSAGEELTDDERLNIKVILSAIFPGEGDLTGDVGDELESIDWFHALISRQWDWFEEIIGLRILAEEFNLLADEAWDHIDVKVAQRKLNLVTPLEWIEFVFKVLGKRWLAFNYFFERDSFKHVMSLREMCPKLQDLYKRHRDKGYLVYSWD